MRAKVSGLVCVSLLLTASGAFAQESPPTVRIHAHSVENRQEVSVVMHGTAQVVCTSDAPPARKPQGVRRPFRGGPWGDCVADVAPGSQLDIMLGNGGETHLFTAPDEPGAEVNLEVLPPDRRDEKRSGVLMLVVGGVGVAVGGLLYLWSAPDGFFHDESGATTGAVILAVGAAFVVGGVALLASGPREPRVESEGVTRQAAMFTRARETTTSLPSIVAPLGYGFAF